MPHVKLTTASCKKTSPCLKWPHRTRPPDFISTEITNNNESKFLTLPPILYIVSFPRSAALKYLRHMVEVLGADINAKYCIEDAAVPGVTVGQTTPLGWFLYVTRWNPAEYRATRPCCVNFCYWAQTPIFLS